MAKKQTTKKVDQNTDNVKQLVPAKAELPTLQFEAEFKVKVVMGPKGFKIEVPEDLHHNLASVLIVNKIMLRTLDLFEKQRKITTDKKLKMALNERIPRINHSLKELNKMATEIYHITAMDVLKTQAKDKLNDKKV